LFESITANTLAESGTISGKELVSSSAVQAAADCSASLIIVLTESGEAAQLVAKYRPDVPILAVCVSGPTIKQLSLARGVIPVDGISWRSTFIQHPEGTEDMLRFGIETARDMGLVAVGNNVVVVDGVFAIEAPPNGIPPQTAGSFLRVVEVSNSFIEM
jgi:pyruvate kinase